MIHTKEKLKVWIKNKRDVIKLVSLALILILCFFMRLNNFLYLENMDLELEGMAKDPTFVLVILYQMLPENIGYLCCLLSITMLVFVIPNKHKSIRCMELLSATILLSLTMFILIFTVNYSNEHLYPAILHAVRVLSLIPSPSYPILLVQVSLYIILAICLFDSFMKVIRGKVNIHK